MPHGLRYLVAAVQVDSDVPVHDFIGVDANGDRDTDDPDDIPGLHLPFCMVSALTLSDVSLDAAFAGGTAALYRRGVQRGAIYDGDGDAETTTATP